ncbi:MAG: HisA/HisF-related TIM barrel protein, partial [Cutibacterium granulosum]|nr:HisA/HisF-related TIM barrel protein [Cutibacterium granulosum]
MGVALRVVACLDVKDGRVVKGVNFTGLRDAGDPVGMARSYGEQGVDELTFLDISASEQGRRTTMQLVTRCANTVFIPLTVGGGVRTVDDVDALLRHGADKVSINTAAIVDPGVIATIADRFGNQVVTLSLDARREAGQPSGFGVTPHGGSRAAGLDAVEWARHAVDLGAGEIL